MTCINCLAYSTFPAEFAEVKSDVKLLIRLVSMLLKEGDTSTALHSVDNSISIPSNFAVPAQKSPVYNGGSRQEKSAPHIDAVTMSGERHDFRSSEFVDVKMEEIPVCSGLAFAEDPAGQCSEAAVLDNHKAVSFDVDCSRYEIEAISSASLVAPRHLRLPLEPTPSDHCAHSETSCTAKPIILESGEIVFESATSSSSSNEDYSSFQANQSGKLQPPTTFLRAVAIRPTANKKVRLDLLKPILPKPSQSVAKPNKPGFHSVNGSPVFVCKCGLKFTVWRQFSDHKKTHQSEVRFACATCGKQYKEQRHVFRHEATAHLGVTFPCAFCKSAYTREYYRNKHELSCTSRP